MLNAGQIVSLQADATARWHQSPDWRPASDEFEALVIEQHRANYELWHEEDEARDPGATPERIVEIKRAIDRLNQRRNDLMERIDFRLLEEAGKQRAEAPLHSETPGMMIDRLSILDLKRFHTEEQIARAGADEQHGQRNRDRLAVIEEQRDDLRDALNALWSQVLSGQRRFKLYRQMKMYNDPSLNPVLYRARQAE